MPSNMLWLPRLRDEYGLDLKINPTYMPTVEARGIYRAARQCKPEPAIRFWGCFTDGGCDLNRRQYWMDHLFAPNSLESYCSATMNNVHCVGLLSNPEGAKARDEGKARYRDYLLRRLRVPAGVVFGHGLVDLALIQGSEEVDSAVMQRLQANSLAELEHLFLEFYQELMLGNTLGRLLLHGLVGSQREAERAHMATVAAGIERHISETNEELKVDPGDANRLFDDEPLGSLAFSDCSRAGTTVGVIDKLTVSRAGHFSCPILAGVIFIACCNPHACRSSGDVKHAVMNLPSREECRVFDNLKDEATVTDAVSSGKLPPRTMHVACKAGSYYVFGSGASLKGASSAASSTIGPLRPLVWFKFHTRTEASKWRADPVTVWEGQDPDLATPSNVATQSTSTSNAPDQAGPSEAEPAAADGVGSSSGPEPVAPASTSAVGSIVGEIAQIAHAWLGGGGHPEAMSASSDSEYEPQELEMASSEEIESGESSEMGADGEEEEDLVAEEDEDEDTDVDMDGEPRGTRGRNRLDITLPGRVAGNLVLVKLIDQEDLMHEWDDQHDDPNIDINHVIFSGRTLNLPPGVALST
ncbi:g6137 [Coccomyxa elongata]